MKSAKSAAPRSAKPDESPSPCIEVTIRWGASVLHVAHLDPPRSFYVGEDPKSGADCDCFLPASMIGASRAPLVVVDDGTVKIAILPDATGTIEIPGQPARDVAEIVATSARSGEGSILVAFPPGAKASIEVHGIVFSIASVNAGRPVAGHFHTDQKALPFYAGAALLHLGLLAACSFFPPDPEADDLSGVTIDQVRDMQTVFQAIAEKELQETELDQIAENTADAREGGTGARAKGEEGSMGAPNAKESANRYGVQGPSNSPAERQASLRDAAEFGMIGLLNSGAGGDPNAPTAPWGRDDSLSGVGLGGGGIGFVGGGAGLAHGVGAAKSGGAGSPSAVIPGASAGVLAPAYPMPSAAPAEASIDPNGRFATTYRPGGGHLAAFESAVARGLIPVAEREVVSDVGARYTPTLAVADGRALAFRADAERGALSPSGGAFHVRLALQSSAIAAESRPHLSVHLVLDVSGSMAGESLSRAKDAAAALVDKLAPTDDFSLVTFSTDANVKVADGLVGPRRGFIKQVINDIREEGGTNISDGLKLGYAQASLSTIPEDAVRVVFLLSDGRPNSGLTNGDALSRLALDAFQHGIQTSSFGLGTDYDGALMSSIASDGAGGYYYLRDPSQIAPALSTELDKRLDPVATAVEVRVRLKPDVDLLRVYGSRRLSDAEGSRVRATEVAADVQAAKRDHIKADRQDDAEGGMRFFIPAFARSDSHALLLKLRVPAGVGSRGIAGIELKYKDRIAKKNVVEEIPIKINYADSDAASAATTDASVARTVQGFAAGEALTDAAVKIAHGDRAGAEALLAEREEILRQAADTLKEPLFLRDASRLARLREEANPAHGNGDPLVLAMVLETAGRSHLR